MRVAARAAATVKNPVLAAMEDPGRAEMSEAAASEGAGPAQWFRGHMLGSHSARLCLNGVLPRPGRGTRTADGARRSQGEGGGAGQRGQRDQRTEE